MEEGAEKGAVLRPHRPETEMLSRIVAEHAAKLCDERTWEVKRDLAVRKRVLVLGGPGLCRCLAFFFFLLSPQRGSTVSAVG
jgi:hypothetical protein